MEFVNASVLLVGIAALLIFIYGPWQTICIDWARNSMFEARDAVFDIAAQGHVDFESPDYIEIRDGFNSLIRFAHRISWPALFCIYFATGTGPKKSPARLALERIENREIRNQIYYQVNKASKAAVFLLFLRSPAFSIVLAIGLIVRLVTRSLGLVTRSLDKAAYALAERIQSEADQYDEAEQAKLGPRIRTAH